LIVYPSYEILEPGEGVESSSYTARIKKGLDLRYQEKNIALPPVVTEDERYKSYTWSVKNLVPVADEDSSHLENRLPSILLAPNRFQLDSYEGDMSSWNGFGKWYADLQKGTDALPEERKSFFRNLIQGAKDDREKTRIIYSYLQQNFRYVAIELGIGGYKPLPAEFTDKKKYGDCKGLSNYMQAVLAVVGIKSYQALVMPDIRANRSILFSPVIFLIMTSFVCRIQVTASGWNVPAGAMSSANWGSLPRTGMPC
jgi:transglutaminase-like putative cysteine protease